MVAARVALAPVGHHEVLGVVLPVLLFRHPGIVRVPAVAPDENGGAEIVGDGGRAGAVDVPPVREAEGGAEGDVEVAAHADDRLAGNLFTFGCRQVPAHAHDVL